MDELGCLVGVLGAVASWGPVGILAGIVARELSRQEPSPARPSSDYGIPAFFTGVLTWAVVGIAGSVVSVLLGMRAHYRASAQANHRP